jgi:hypothetical protein
MVPHAMRRSQSSPSDPIVHDLNPIRIDGYDVPIRLSIRRVEDGSWRGRMAFVVGESGGEVQTAEIFCGASEKELWDSVGHLREHHLRDLYRSLSHD